MSGKSRLIMMNIYRNLMWPQKMINVKICGNMKKCFQYSVNFKNYKSLVNFQLCKKFV